MNRHLVDFNCTNRSCLYITTALFCRNPDAAAVRCPKCGSRAERAWNIAREHRCDGVNKKQRERHEQAKEVAGVDRHAK